MTTTIIGGASGDLGTRIVTLLLEQLSPERLILLTRTPEKLAWASELGAQVRQADYDDPDGLEQALAGGDTLMLISTLSIGRRPQQHGNAINAARAAGIGHIVYTSSIGIQPRTPSLSGQEHYATEVMLQGSGVNYTILRNGWYAEVVPTLIMKPSMDAGAFVASTGNGSIAPVSKQVCARAAAAVLAAPANHDHAIYEITGPDLLTFSDIAALMSRLSGKQVPYVNVSHEEKQAIFDSLGVSRDYEEGMMNEQTNAWASSEMITYEMAIKQLYFAICSRHVELLTGTPAAPLEDVIMQHAAAWQ